MTTIESQQALQISVLTAVGRGAIATIAVHGNACFDEVSKFFRPAGSAFRLEIDRIRYGLWSRGSDSETGESVVVCCTSDDDIEIYCHGGRAAVDALVDDLRGVGAVQVHATQWLHRTQPDRLKIECLQTLAKTQTPKTCAIVLDQVRGALRLEVLKGIGQLAAGDVQPARETIKTLLARFAIGRAATTPFRVVIAGPPNVGKSSLLNKLLGYERAIAFDQPGTTRDVLYSTTTLNGWTIELLDTAGIHDTSDTIEHQGVMRAQHEVQSADLVLIVADAVAGWTQQHADITTLAMQSILVLNKIDLLSEDCLLSAENTIRTSTLTGEGIDDLIQAILRRLTPHQLVPGMAIPITQRQVDCLQQSLAANEVDDATAALQSLLVPPAMPAALGNG